MKLTAVGNNPAVKRVIDLAFRIVPISGLVAISAYVAAQQAVSPNRRMVKLAVLFGLLVLMLRFDLVYAVYLFTILYPFPSNVSIGSTNSILMTVIPLIWAVRASSTKTKLLVRKTRVDVWIAAYLLAHVVSFYNVETTSELTRSLQIMWRTVATAMYFYMIVLFVDDEKKIIRMTKVMCGVCGFVMLTGVLEAFFPGVTIIPGWMKLASQAGEGKLSYRIEGIRVGGVFGSHGLLSDFGTQMFFLMVYHLVRSRNAIEKLVWLFVTLVTVAAIVTTANRGAFFGFILGLVYLLFVFRKQISVPKMIMIVAAVTVMFTLTEMALTRYSYAVSLTDRILGTEFKGIVPDTRTSVWKPALIKSLDHPFIGHGPVYETGKGLERMFWPHNGYIFYLYTIGIIGLVTFLAVIFRVWQYSIAFRLPGASGTRLGDISRILHVTLVVMLFEQLRTDHQRDDIYPFIVWMLFGLITATAITLRDGLEKEKERESGSVQEPAGDTG